MTLRRKQGSVADGERGMRRLDGFIIGFFFIFALPLAVQGFRYHAPDVGWGILAVYLAGAFLYFWKAPRTDPDRVPPGGHTNIGIYAYRADRDYRREVDRRHY